MVGSQALRLLSPAKANEDAFCKFMTLLKVTKYLPLHTALLLLKSNIMYLFNIQKPAFQVMTYDAINKQ